VSARSTRAAALTLARAVPGHARRHASSRPSRPAFAQTVQGARAGRGRVLHGQGSGGEGDGALTLPDPGDVHPWFLDPSDASEPVDSEPYPKP